MKASSSKARTTMAILAVVIGVFAVSIAPLIVQTSLERVLIALSEVVQERPAFSSGISLFSLFYPLWRALAFIAGVTLLVIAPQIYKGEEWTYPVALVAYATPSIGGMFMFLPYISWVGGFPLPMVLSWVALIGFWGTIFLQDGDLTQKLADFFTLTFIGMLATHSFTLGIGSQRMLITRPGKPLFEGLDWWILTWVGEVDWIATVLLLVAIPLLAMRKSSGWWLALIASLSVLLIDAPTQIIRTKTLDYLYGSLLSAGTLFFLLLPIFKERLTGAVRSKLAHSEPTETQQSIAATG